jgi:hypothetical protein
VALGDCRLRIFAAVWRLIRVGRVAFAIQFLAKSNPGWALPTFIPLRTFRQDGLTFLLQTGHPIALLNPNGLHGNCKPESRYFCRSAERFGPDGLGASPHALARSKRT